MTSAITLKAPAESARVATIERLCWWCNEAIAVREPYIGVTVDHDKPALSFHYVCYLTPLRDSLRWYRRV